MEELFKFIKSDYHIELKDFQKAAIQSVLNGSNTFVSVETGGGKTYCYSFLPVLFDKFKMCENSIVLIISPLIGLMVDQVSKLQELGVSACYVGDSHDKLVTEGINAGKFSAVFVSPEGILGPWRKLLKKESYKKNIKAIIVDEVHCVSQWGNDFRPQYSKLSSLKAIISSDIPWCCLTATATVKVFEEVKKVLCLTDIKVIKVQSTRDNLYFHFEKIKTGYSCLQWYIQELNILQSVASKAIIYCRNVNTVAQIYATITNALGDSQFIGEHNFKNRIIGMFHRSTAQENKDHILHKFGKSDSKLRCVVATSAFGMGIDVPDIKFVIQYSSPRSIESYIQQGGRAGRNGEQAYNILYYKSQNMCAGQTDEAMRKLLKSTACTKQLVQSHFQLDKVDIQFSHASSSIGTCKCCSACSKSCKCGREHRLEWEYDELPDSVIVTAERENIVERQVSPELLTLLQCNLEDYKNSLYSQFGISGLYSPEAVVPFNSKMIQDIINNCAHLLAAEDVMTELNINDPHLAKDIITLVNEVL